MSEEYWQDVAVDCPSGHFRQELNERRLPAMTPWIVLLTLVVLFTWAVRRGPAEPPFPYGYDGERQLSELRGLVNACTCVRLP
jgi:hypothetical protein